MFLEPVCYWYLLTWKHEWCVLRIPHERTWGITRTSEGEKIIRRNSMASGMTGWFRRKIIRNRRLHLRTKKPNFCSLSERAAGWFRTWKEQMRWQQYEGSGMQRSDVLLRRQGVLTGDSDIWKRSRMMRMDGGVREMWKKVQKKDLTEVATKAMADRFLSAYLFCLLLSCQVKDR